MKRMILSLVALVMMLGSVSAQRLVSVKNYGANWQKTMISLKNKPNGTIYRLRKENQNEYLPRVPEAKGLEQFISERIDIGWLAMYRLPMSDDDYKFIVVIYDKDEHPLYTVNLGEVAQNDYCEVQDVRCSSTWPVPVMPAVSTARGRNSTATILSAARWCGPPIGSPATTSSSSTLSSCSVLMASPVRRSFFSCSIS